MITEDYVSYEVAKLLKEKDFETRTNMVYRNPNNPIIHNEKEELIPNHYKKTIGDVNEILAPTLQMAMKWLRNKGIYIQIRRNINTYLYGAIMLKDSSGIYATIPSELETYEEAVEAALKYALENLI